MNFDSKTNIKQELALNIAAISSDTTTAGNEIDTAGYGSLTLIPATGALTDGTYTILVEESDTSGSGFTAVADDFLIGTEAGAAITTANTATKIGVVSKKRYIKASIVSTGVTTGATVGVVAILGSPLHAPVV